MMPIDKIGASSITVQASDVGLWMALPAVAPAMLLSAVLVFLAVRDRRRHPHIGEPETRAGSEET